MTIKLTEKERIQLAVAADMMIEQFSLMDKIAPRSLLSARTKLRQIARAALNEKTK